VLALLLSLCFDDCLGRSKERAACDKILWPTFHAGIGSLGPIYMVGDNPKSDIAGANSMGWPWKSVLVRSGVFQGENDKEHPADVVVDDVAEAVSLALKRC
jgi:ribonucleotide monophosphatase NagD (HAD superfamily)